MKSLILDSSTKKLYCALVVDNTLIYETYVSGQNDHSKRIVEVVRIACEKAKIDVLDLDEVICGIGPGSYTGVRMAITVCKMLASLSSIQMKQISTLCLMASGCKDVAKVCIDARRGNAFMGFYQEGNSLYEEGLYPMDFSPISYEQIIDEENYIVNPFLVLEKATLVSNPFLVIPNYLRQTEAERNINHDHQKD